MKVMFVDDDPLVIRRLHQLLQWEKEGYKIVDAAYDGQDALEKIKKGEIPDILICDINMPKMNGISLAKKLIEIYPSMQIIILTVNDSFNVSYQALNMGVIHYILKPLNKKELLNALKKANSNVYSNNIKNDSIKKINEVENKKQKLVLRSSRNQFLRYLVSGYKIMSKESIEKCFTQYHISFNVDKFAMFCIHPNDNEKFIENSFSENTIDEIEMNIEDQINSMGKGVVFCDNTYDFAVLIGFENFDADLDFFENIANSIQNNLKQQNCFSSTIIISSIYTNLKDIYRCYYETKYFHPLSNFSKSQGIIKFSDVFEKKEITNFEFEKTREKIMENLRKKNTKILSQLIHHALYQSKISSNSDVFRMVRTDLILTGIIFMKENKIDMSQLPELKTIPLLAINKTTDEKEIFNFINNFYEILINYTASQKISSGKRITEMVIELTNSNLNNPSLCVSWIASKIYINENHLSRQFKAQTGYQLVKYIRNQRLKKARELIIGGNSNIHSVSDEVGFSDPYYFSKCFKKKYGLAPSQLLNKRCY